MATEALVWISGASGGIGRAMAASVPWSGARVIEISRMPPGGREHIEADLSDPLTWHRVGASFKEELAGFDGDRVVFIHAAGTVEPLGFAGEVETAPYERNVILNSAAPQALGHLFLNAVRGVKARRHLIMFTSGAAKSVYPGWASYGAAKAAVDQWVRDVGAEQIIRGGVQVLSVAPGTVNTGMQARLRAAGPDDFPQRQKFIDLHEADRLAAPIDVAHTIWGLLDGELDSGSVVDLRELAT